ncbi:MAG: hypothetical protein KJO05_07055 [Bacteroidia bacterium]|nr:hypothetical protein [Bacteroidia bacterium]NNF30571.1 hypothetical protein [Flavobacteriaceae bacterium]MBT8277095.1 hypothetical protein [Bacteroidia bacterium]NNJ81282.1 hypothetical protein [Flavobacteriaceae bacterium]NNK53108.1 hypothetical protein [Flavobacteriaceae bacterium]
MKKKFVLLTILLASVLFQAAAQNFGGDPTQLRAFTNSLHQVDEFIKRQNMGIDFADKESYTGTPYNHPSYLPGNVYKGKELLATNVALRYNAIADEMEIKESIETIDADAKALTKSPDIYVKIVNDIFVFVPYDGGIEGGGYFQVLTEGNKVDLFKKIKKDFSAAKKATTSITRDIPAKFTDKPVYFLVTKEGKFYELPSSKKKKLKVFSDNANLVKKYVNSNNLDLNDEKDLIRVIKYYDGV